MLKYYIVDVFAQSKYTGNPLAVFTHAEKLSSEVMQKIAKEINYSETTFILSNEPRNGGYDVRIFTPNEELPFAGHPTLGTAAIIQSQIIQKPIDKLLLNLKVGQIPVTWSEEDKNLLRMQQNPPQFSQEFTPQQLATVLSLEETEIDSRFPIQSVSTGLPFIIVPLKTQAALKRIQLQREKYWQLIENSEAKCILVFCPETNSPEHDLSVRMFADYLGIPEDPATGSANGCLAGYLVKHRYFGQSTLNITVEQGYEINRPSLLFLQAHSDFNAIQVTVGGKVVLVAQGEWFE